MTLERFRVQYRKREDGFKYEWNNGIIEKTPTTMSRAQFYIFLNLNRLFCLTNASKEGGGLGQELEVLTSPTQIRKPDIAYLSYQEAIDEEEPIPKFVIEIISSSDNINRVNIKVEEYLKAGVQIIWHIFPSSKTVHIYQTPNNMTICKDGDICSAEPVILGFVISVNDIFKRAKP